MCLSCLMPLDCGFLWERLGSVFPRRTEGFNSQFKMRWAIIASNFMWPEGNCLWSSGSTTKGGWEQIRNVRSCQCQDTMQKIYTGNRWDHKYVWNVESIYQCTLTSKCVSSSRRNRNIHTNIVSFYPFRSIWHNNMDTGWESAIHSRVTVFLWVCVCVGVCFMFDWGGGGRWHHS